MGDARYEPAFRRIVTGDDAVAEIQASNDEELVQALAHASREASPYVANVIASELMNRLRRKNAIFENAGEGMLSQGPDGRIVYANPAAERMLGRSLDELRGLDVHAQVHEAATGLHRAECPILRVAEVGGSINVERDAFACADGTSFPVAYAASAVMREGEVEGVVVVFRDITSELRSQAALGRWAQIFEHAKWGIVIGTGDGRILDEMNPEFARMHGWSAAELRGRPIEDVFAPEERDRLRENVALAHERGHHLWDSVHVRKDGSRFPVTIDVTAVKDAQGRILYRIANVQDVTERQRMEEALRESEERFRRVFEESPLGIAIVAQDFRFVDANDALCRMVGYTRDELRSKTFEDITHPEDLALDVGLARQLFRGDIPSYQIEKRYIAKDGRIIWISLSGSVVRNADGSVRYAIGAIEDVTLRKAAEDALTREHAKLEALSAVASAANRATHIEEALVVALEQVARVTGWPVGHAWILDEDRRTLVSSGVWRVSGGIAAAPLREASASLRIAPGTLIPGMAALTQSIQWSGNIARDPRFARGAAAAAAGLAMVVEAPVLVGGRVEAVLEFFAPRVAEPSPDTRALLAHVSDALARVFDRSNADRTLRASEARFRSAAESMLDPFTIYRAVRDEGGAVVDFAVEFANDAAARFSGVARDAMRGRTMGQLFPGSTSTPLFAEYARVAQGGPALERTLEPGLSGRLFDLRVVGLGEGICATWRDVTAATARARELRESEARLRSLADNLPDAVSRFDPDMRQTYANPAALAAAGLTFEQAVGRTLGELSFPAALVAAFETGIADVLRDGKQRDLLVDFVGPKGPVRYQVRLAPERDDRGVIEHVLSISREVPIAPTRNTFLADAQI